MRAGLSAPRFSLFLLEAWSFPVLQCPLSHFRGRPHRAPLKPTGPPGGRDAAEDPAAERAHRDDPARVAGQEPEGGGCRARPEPDPGLRPGERRPPPRPRPAGGADRPPRLRAEAIDLVATLLGLAPPHPARSGGHRGGTIHRARRGAGGDHGGRGDPRRLPSRPAAASKHGGRRRRQRRSGKPSRPSPPKSRPSY